MTFWKKRNNGWMLKCVWWWGNTKTNPLRWQQRVQLPWQCWVLKKDKGQVSTLELRCVFLQRSPSFPLNLRLAYSLTVHPLIPVPKVIWTSETVKNHRTFWHIHKRYQITANVGQKLIRFSDLLGGVSRSCEHDAKQEPLEECGFSWLNTAISAASIFIYRSIVPVSLKSDTILWALPRSIMGNNRQNTCKS